MENKQGYTTIKAIVQRVLFNSGEDDLGKYALYKGFAIDCMKMFNMDILQEVKTVKLTMDNIKQVDIPSDYVDMVKIGVQIGDKIKVFLKDSNIALYNELTDCGEPIPNISAEKTITTTFPDPTVYPFYFFNYLGGGTGLGNGGFFGYGGGPIQNAFVIEGRKIRFNSDVETSDVYLEYVSDGFNPSEESVVPTIVEMAIRPYIKWQEACFDRRKGPLSADAQGWKKEFGLEVNKAKSRVSKLNIESILYASRLHYKLSIKN